MKPKANDNREVRKARVRRKIQGTDARPRLCVFRSLKYTTAQLVSDESSKVILGISTKVINNGSPKGVESAQALGKKIAELAKEQKIAEVVFDRNGYRFHGRIKAVADGAREAGLQF